MNDCGRVGVNKWTSVVQCVVVCCSVLQCVAVCYSAVTTHMNKSHMSERGRARVNK